MLNLVPFSTNEPDIFDYLDAFSRSFNVPRAREVMQFKTDIKEYGDHFQLSAELPGFNKEEISIDLNEGILTISAKHAEETKSDDSKENSDDKEALSTYICKERREYNYKRHFNMKGIDTKQISASYNNGILELTLPKESKKESEHITIDVA